MFTNCSQCLPNVVQVLSNRCQSFTKFLTQFDRFDEFTNFTYQICQTLTNSLPLSVEVASDVSWTITCTPHLEPSPEKSKKSRNWGSRPDFDFGTAAVFAGDLDCVRQLLGEAEGPGACLAANQESRRCSSKWAKVSKIQCYPSMRSVPICFLYQGYVEENKKWKAS